MNDRWSHLLSFLREHFPTDADVAEVEAYLSSEGYDRSQIDEIVLAYVTDLSRFDDYIWGLARTSIPFRVMGTHERGRFAPEAWGHLLSLANGGMISSSQLEGLIERALAQFDGRITLDDIRSLLESGDFDEFGPSPDHVTIH